MRVPPVKNPTYAAFEEYEDVLDIAPLGFMANDHMGHIKAFWCRRRAGSGVNSPS